MANTSKNQTHCLICENPISTFLSFGKMPIANGFLTVDQFKDEHFFELKVGFCSDCLMVQLTELVDEQKMFHENYAFFSSTSARMGDHFKTLADEAKQRFSVAENQNSFVVEIGCNDGIMLQHFANAGIRHLGIEPSLNVAQVANTKGVKTVSEFFTRELADRIVQEHGHADLFLGANVMCHIPYMHSVVDGIKHLLKPTGVLIFEDPYLGDIIEKTSYDQIYDEHAFYFSVGSVKRLAERHGLEVFDVKPVQVHGGSMRYYIGHTGAHSVSEEVTLHMKREKALGLHLPETYQKFSQNVARSKENLVSVLRDLKSQGKRVVAYGATSKSTTVTNFCGIGPDLVEFISDTTPIKQGKFSPGAHIPVRPYVDFKNQFPDYALLFAWNHGDEIMAKETAFRESGGKFLLYVPEVKFA
jgi:methylation protein EvaC